MFVKQYRKPVVFLTLCSILVLVLVACGTTGGGTTGGGTTSSSTPTLTPSPTPTTASLTTYTGTGYTIGYPQGWNMTSPTSGTVVFTDPTGKYAFTIAAIPNPGGTLSSDQVAKNFESTLQSGSQFTGIQNQTTASTTTVAGESWSQIAATATTSGTQGKLIIIADNHPKQSPSTMAYVIAYGGPQANFDQINTSDFQPMLQSFTFTS